jgi:hypothetical protein
MLHLPNIFGFKHEARLTRRVYPPSVQVNLYRIASERNIQSGFQCSVLPPHGQHVGHIFDNAVIRMWLSRGVPVVLPGWYRFALVPALCGGDETESRPFPEFSDAELDLHARSSLMLEHIKV